MMIGIYDNLYSLNLSNIKIENIENDILNYLFKDNYHMFIN